MISTERKNRLLSPLINRQRISRHSRPGCVPDSNGGWSVSYTHLDVYKRQPCSCSPFLSDLTLLSGLFAVPHYSIRKHKRKANVSTGFSNNQYDLIFRFRLLRLLCRYPCRRCLLFASCVLRPVRSAVLSATALIAATLIFSARCHNCLLYTSRCV